MGGELARITESLWTSEALSEQIMGAPRPHRVLPDPEVSVACRCARDERGRPTDLRLVLVGPVTRPQLLPIRHGVETVAVRIKREWAARLLDVVPSEHANAAHDLRAIAPGFADATFGPLSETRGAREALEVLTSAVLQLVRRLPTKGSTPIAAKALDRIRETGGRQSVERVASDLGVSNRNLRRVVQRDAGISVKAYSRTVRVLRAVMAADRAGYDSRPSWVGIAYEAGYCDQSHLVGECRALCGLTPEQVHRERRAEDLAFRHMAHRDDP